MLLRLELDTTSLNGGRPVQPLESRLVAPVLPHVGNRRQDRCGDRLREAARPGHAGRGEAPAAV